MKLAIISSYNEDCGNATYARALEKAFQNHFEVTVFNLKTASLIAHAETHNSAAAEAHIDKICADLAQFDCINLHIEWSLYGREPTTIHRRLKKLIDASARLIVTLHSLQHKQAYWQDLQYGIMQTLKARDNSRPYWFLTHLPRETATLHADFAIDNVTDFPVVYLSRQDIEAYQKIDRLAWKRRWGFKDNDIVILRAGFLAPHKDHLTSLKSLALLPPNYKLAFAGGEHPASIQKNAISPQVLEITNYLEEFDAPALQDRIHTNQQTATLGDRIRFLGHLSDDELYQAMACADFVTMTHLESGQSASGIATIAVQLERPTILSRNHFFIEYEKYYKGALSLFTMGNPYELRDKILYFDAAQIDRLKSYGIQYSLDSLALLYQKIFTDLCDQRVNNAGRPMTLPPRPRPTPKDVLRRFYCLLPEGIQNILRQARNALR